MTTLDLDAIKARAGAATPGPWTARTNYPHLVLQADDDVVSTNLAGNPVADAAFIAAARSDVPELVREVERLRSRRGYASQRLDKAREAAEALLRKEQQHSGSGREGHLNEDDLVPLFEALGAIYLDDPNLQILVDPDGDPE